MKKALIVVFVLALGIAPTIRAQEEFSEVEYYKQLAEKQLAEAEAQAEPEPVAEIEPAALPVVETAAAPIAQAVPVYYYPVQYQYVEEEPEPPANAFVAIPQYFNSRNGNAKGFKVGSTKLQMAKGHASGAGTTLLYNRRVTDWFSFALMYEYGFMNVKSGMAVPEGTAATARERSRWHSHVVGVLPEFSHPQLGKLQLSLIQGFDRASGYEQLGADRRDVDDYGTDVTSLMAWWQKDVKLGCSNWTITPYAGWRSLYVSVKDQNNFAVAAGAPGSQKDDNLWVHLISGGMKASYQNGDFGMGFRAGINHRTTHDDLPGYGNRAVAPGVVQFSHRANMDKTVGTFGVNFNYMIKKRAIVGVGYDALVGKDTSAHLGSLNFILPF